MAKTFEKIYDILTLKNHPFLKRGAPMVAIFGVSYYGFTHMTSTMVNQRSARKNMMSFEDAEKQFGLTLKPKEERNLPGRCRLIGRLLNTTQPRMFLLTSVKFLLPLQEFNNPAFPPTAR